MSLWKVYILKVMQTILNQSKGKAWLDTVRFFSSEQPQNINEQVHFPLKYCNKAIYFTWPVWVRSLWYPLKSWFYHESDLENPNPPSSNPIKPCSCFPGINDLFKSFVKAEQPNHQTWAKISGCAAEIGAREEGIISGLITAINSSWTHRGDVFGLPLIKWDLALWSCWVFLFRNNIKITFDLHQSLKGFRCCHPE